MRSIQAAPTARWERTTLARAIALLVVRYRSEHELTQAALAKRLGVSQPAVARLELGEHDPTLETLAPLARALDTELVLDLAPNSRKRTLLSREAERRELGRFTLDGAIVLVAAA